MNKKIYIYAILCIILLSSVSGLKEYVHLKANNDTVNSGADDAVFNWTSTISYTAGKIGSGFDFDQTGDYVRQTSGLNLDTDGFNESEYWSMAMWYSTQETTNGRVIWAIGGGTGTALSHETQSSKESLCDCSVYRDIVIPTSTGAWQHLVINFNVSAGIMQIFINGSNTLNYTNANLEFNHGGELTLGSNRAGANGLFTIIDDFRLYNSTLNQSNIDAIYNAGAGTEDSLEPSGGGGPPAGGFNISSEWTIIPTPVGENTSQTIELFVSWQDPSNQTTISEISTLTGDYNGTYNNITIISGNYGIIGNVTFQMNVTTPTITITNNTPVNFGFNYTLWNGTGLDGIAYTNSSTHNIIWQYNRINITVTDAIDSSTVGNFTIRLTNNDTGIYINEYTTTGTNIFQILKTHSNLSINTSQINYQKNQSYFEHNSIITNYNTKLLPRKLNIRFSENTDVQIIHGGGSIGPFYNISQLIVQNANITNGTAFIVFNNLTSAQVYAFDHDPSIYVRVDLLVEEVDLQKPFETLDGVTPISGAHVCASKDWNGTRWQTYCGLTGTDGGIYLNLNDQTAYYISATATGYTTYASVLEWIDADDLSTYTIQMGVVTDPVQINTFVGTCPATINTPTTCLFRINSGYGTYSQYFNYQYNGSNITTATQYGDPSYDLNLILNATYTYANVSAFVNGVQVGSVYRVEYINIPKNVSAGFSSFGWADDGLNRTETIFIIILTIVGSAILGMLSHKYLGGYETEAVAVFLIIFGIASGLWQFFVMVFIITAVKIGMMIIRRGSAE